MIIENHLIAPTTAKEKEGWIARINNIHGDKLIVSISEEDGEVHHAIWSKKEIEEKLSDNEYYLVGKCHD